MRKYSFLLAIMILLAYGRVFAQQAVTSATLSGFVEDASGARIPKAFSSAQNLDRNQTWTTTSDAEGRFRFLLLPVGEYELKIEAQGFAPFTRRTTLTIGQALDIPIRLQVEGQEETVEVTSDIPLVESVRTQVRSEERRVGKECRL